MTVTMATQKCILKALKVKYEIGNPMHPLEYLVQQVGTKVGGEVTQLQFGSYMY